MVLRNIHQVWEGKTEPVIPVKYRIFSETWKTNHPNWNFYIWKKKDMDQLVREFFPDLSLLYKSVIYDVQRWDMIRYMILYIVGGIYTDFDTECFKPLEPLVDGKTLCFGEESPAHNIYPEFHGKRILGNAFMYSQPQNKVWLYLLSEIEKNIDNYQSETVLNTTGPLMLTRNQEALFNKYNASLLSYQDVAPVTRREVFEYAYEVDSTTLPSKTKESYCVHYFFGSWDDKNCLYK